MIKYTAVTCLEIQKQVSHTQAPSVVSINAPFLIMSVINVIIATKYEIS